jgi:hypothetical protein
VTDVLNEYQEQRGPKVSAPGRIAYRKRQRQGLQYVHILLHVTEIDTLIHMGLLKDDQRTDADALQTAVLDLVYRAIGSIGPSHKSFGK